MGCPCELQLFAADEAEARRAAALAVAEVARLDAKYTTYREDSFLAEINRAAASGGCIDVDAETARLLDYADACHRESGGLFDVTAGVLRAAWRCEGGALPDAAELEALRAKVGWHRVAWRAPRLAFPLAGMQIDFGGVVKEYAADRVVALCRAEGVHGGLVNLGGDLAIVGPRPDGEPWRIGVRHPRERDRLAGTFVLHDGALASSGDYERCVVIDGVRYGHILDPRTGWPVRHLASVSAVADFCIVAGSASTIAMLKQEAGPAWLAEQEIPHHWMDVHGGSGGTL
ncbi:MAG TPA: FAD:protein FMN transferase, partial [Myxococcota bacterium]|nr:FAD:protein FMN transferase [Myxococcota bacterium]